MLYRTLTMLSLAAFTFMASAAEYTLSVEPNYPADQAREIYNPLIQYLNKTTGHKFKLKTVSNYHAYWRDILADAPADFTFEEVDFADFRAQRQGYKSLVRVAEPIQFSLIVSPENSDAGPRGLLAGNIVSMPSPSLGYLFLGELYPNPIAQPEIVSNAQTWKDGVDMVFAQEALGAMVPVYIAEQYPNLISVHQSRSLPGRTLSASGKVPAAVRKSVADAMLKLQDTPEMIDVLTELGTTGFIPTSEAEIAGNERMLRRVFGYPKTTPASAATAPAAGPATPAASPVKK